MKPTIAALLVLSAFAIFPQKAAAWGDDGHKVAALIAEHYLTPAAKKQVDAMLAADTDELTKHDIASEATWADKYRDSNHRKDHYEATKRWHFVDLEITDLDMAKACFGRKPLPPGTLASNGDKMACVVDKVAQFAAELEASGTDAEERRFALKFLLHFIGDMHQPFTLATTTMRAATASRSWSTAFRTRPRTSFTASGIRRSSTRSADRRRPWRSSCWLSSTVRFSGSSVTSTPTSRNSVEASASRMAPR